MKKVSIKSQDYNRYYKQLILKKIGVVGQKKIFNSKVLIIGAGGLGCPLILYLAYSGIGHLGIVDHDKIESSNLSRQILFTEKDIGKYKQASGNTFKLGWDRQTGKDMNQFETNIDDDGVIFFEQEFKF